LKQDVSQKLGISFETYLQKLNKTEKDLLDSFVIEAEKRVRNSLVLGEISKKEKIEVSDGEVKEEMDKFLKNIAPEKLKELDRERLRNYTEDVIKNEKTLKFLESFSQ
jgi:trigger factor